MGGGNCFEAAVRLQDRMARQGHDALVVQATVEAEGLRTWHSWCEFDGIVYDNSNSVRLENGGSYSPGPGVAGGVRGGKMIVEPVEIFYSRRRVQDVRRYTGFEVARHMLRAGIYGVWEPASVTQSVTRMGGLSGRYGL